MFGHQLPSRGIIASFAVAGNDLFCTASLMFLRGHHSTSSLTTCAGTAHGKFSYDLLEADVNVLGERTAKNTSPVLTGHDYHS